MLYREIIAVRSEIHVKHTNILCGQNVELLNVKLAVHVVTTGLYRINDTSLSIIRCTVRHCVAVFITAGAVCGSVYNGWCSVWFCW